ncbi:glycoside hydrolase family 88/105 protein [Chitinophaga rhizophila]|uniref:Glycoside hydrolase family 88 protein n=1 Tax=Chitinophaga rhizophila TaxID=2866212 RepID=A0ABS7GHJ1_9BACT|nr:glycoside hydrolase family 88 protein [Chitinophaga rhizophila]MBW8686791.1 glycoside hydrolase family 88 protein [Chitinophaga rhizophila]
MKKLLLLCCLIGQVASAQKANDVTAPLHALQPDYPMPYKVITKNEVKTTLDRVFTYLDQATPTQWINRLSNKEYTMTATPDSNIIFKQGDFRLTSYEWGVTYAGMTSVGEATGDERYTGYTTARMNFLADAYPGFKQLNQQYPRAFNAMRQPVAPHALDDAGAMCAAMIREYRRTKNARLKPLIDNYITYITTKEYRLPDGTLARNRPLKNSLWLDDLFMSVPALAQMGKLTGDAKYYNDAVKQVLSYSKRMFNKELGVYMHGWVESMAVHPEFHWARANGWAVMAMTELLDVLPENFNGRKEVLAQLKLHVQGLAKYQSGQGFWHQLLDRNDSYLETSATAIYTYAIARGINKGWLDAKAYTPMCLLAWSAVATKVNEKGHVEGTCVGTGMAFDPAYYYYRPVNIYAAHGYGPVLLAGAEVITLLGNSRLEINDSALMINDK